MIIECIGEGFVYRWPGGEIHLKPGRPIDLPDERAQRLLSKAPGRVRVLPGRIRAGDKIYWVRGDGSTCNAVVDFLHTDETGTPWAFVSFAHGGWAAVNLKFARPLEAR